MTSSSSPSSSFPYILRCLFVSAPRCFICAVLLVLIILGELRGASSHVDINTALYEKDLSTRNEGNFNMKMFSDAEVNISSGHRLLSEGVGVTGRKSGRRAVKLYVYDEIKGYLNWVFPWFKDGALRRCGTICTLVDQPAELPNVDVVIFHAPTHMKKESPMKIDTIRTPNHVIFMMISLEQPNYAKVLSNTNYLEKHFDLLATYSRKIDTKSVLQPARPFREKTGYGTGVSVAVFTSNCKAAGAEGRYKYLEELMKLIPIHSYGTCLNNRQEPQIAEDTRWPPVAQRRSRKIKILSRYKFYLAFENLAVEDYVSEKIFEGYFSGALPIYRGTETVGHFTPSNNSFINANGMDPKALANVIKSLENNEQEYNKFFEFKKQPLSAEFEGVALRSYTHPNVLCRICDVADRIKLNREQEGGK